MLPRHKLHPHTALCIRHARWPVLSLRSPIAFLVSEYQLQRPTLRKEFMANPILCVCLPVELCTLNVYVLVRAVEIGTADRRRFVRDWTSDTEALEERWSDEVNVLTGVWKEAEHAEDRKGTHGTRIIVSW
jgi:hypothetical protein